MAALAVATASAAAVVAPSAPARAARPPGPARVAAPDWRPCPDAAQAAAGLQCSSVEVPLDYRAPAGRTITIGISRLPGTDPARRRGALVLNPGGQFASELSLPLRLVALGLPSTVRERYDLIAFDPRGIGASTPVTCDLDAPHLFTIPPARYARVRADITADAGRMRAIADGCGSSGSAASLPHMTVANVARDLDRIRQALGEERVSYLGYSFGTYIGAVYATLFPGRTDRVVLDSVVGPGGMDHTWSRRLGLGAEQRFPDFAAWAADEDVRYGLGDTPHRVRATMSRLAGRLDRAPVERIDGSLLRYLTFALLFSDATFPALAQFWAVLNKATSGSTLDPDEVTLLRQMSNTAFDFSGLLHLACNNVEGWPRGVRAYERDVALDRERYPLFGAASAGLWPCAFWPARTVEPRVRISDDGPSDILMVQNRRDPGTPLAGALQTRRALGQRARMITVEQGGHLVYLHSGNACADAAVTQFLVLGVRPGADRVCPR
ncbi:alpha/beta hydrolase [Actinoplanes siamensis]|uniref:Alpha/beta hydrolase n=1 Tax=Actinoplanes siamensis TaxID=1223317 RepID=A0A919TLW6_9ACTN|nr:alpha/beta hydrolase [Actinoplanes siamensis]